MDSTLSSITANLTTPHKCMGGLKKVLKYLLIILQIGLIIALVVVFSRINAEDILEFSLKSPLVAIFVLLSLFCVKSVIMFIPLAALYISAGIIFPVGLAIILACLGLFCEMTIGYFLGKHLGKTKIFAFVEKNDSVKKHLSRPANKKLSAHFVLRLLPLPFEVVSLLSGASATKFSQYVVFSFLSSIPHMIPYVFIGDAISTPFSKEFLIPFALCTALSMCTFIIYSKWLKSRE